MYCILKTPWASHNYHYITLVSQELAMWTRLALKSEICLPLSVSRVRGLKACAATPGSDRSFKDRYEINSSRFRLNLAYANPDMNSFLVYCNALGRIVLP